MFYSACRVDSAADLGELGALRGPQKVHVLGTGPRRRRRTHKARGPVWAAKVAAPIPSKRPLLSSPHRGSFRAAPARPTGRESECGLHQDTRLLLKKMAPQSKGSEMASVLSLSLSHALEGDTARRGGGMTMKGSDRRR